jgi:hypothetical protein
MPDKIFNGTGFTEFSQICIWLKVLTNDRFQHILSKPISHAGTFSSRRSWHKAKSLAKKDVYDFHGHFGVFLPVLVCCRYQEKSGNPDRTT